MFLRRRVLASATDWHGSQSTDDSRPSNWGGCLLALRELLKLLRPPNPFPSPLHCGLRKKKIPPLNFPSHTLSPHPPISSHAAAVRPHRSTHTAPHNTTKLKKKKKKKRKKKKDKERKEERKRNPTTIQTRRDSTENSGHTQRDELDLFF